MLFFNNDPFCPPPNQTDSISDINTGLSFKETYRQRITDPSKQILIAVQLYTDACTPRYTATTTTNRSEGCHLFIYNNSNSIGKPLSYLVPSHVLPPAVIVPKQRALPFFPAAVCEHLNCSRTTSQLVKCLGCTQTSTPKQTLWSCYWTKRWHLNCYWIERRHLHPPHPRHLRRFFLSHSVVLKLWRRTTVCPSVMRLVLQ